MRERLAGVGPEVRFGARHRADRARGRAVGVRLADGGELLGRAVVVATGHSARDVHELPGRAGVRAEAKAFAMGVRLERSAAADRSHPVRPVRGPPEAAGGAVPAWRSRRTTAAARSRSACAREAGRAGGDRGGRRRGQRDEPVAARLAVRELGAGGLDRGGGPRAPRLPLLGGVVLQRRLEEAAAAAGGALRASATRATDFVRGRASSTVPATSWLPAGPRGGRRRRGAGRDGAAARGAAARGARRVRSPDAGLSVRGGGARRRGVAHLVAGARAARSGLARVAGRGGLYPCGEGAGYAGGIVSAALDGIRVARAISRGAE